MKFWMSIAAAALFCVLGVAPVFAQSARQDLQEYINDHPELQKNPSLINNPNYLARHPKLNHFLQTHPNVDRKRYGRMGAYDHNHQWRDADWWHQNDPNWVYQNHRDWIQQNPSWMNSGDYDDSHRWHNREWWEHNDPNWVRKRHPNWAREHRYAPPPHYEAEHHQHGNAYGHEKHHGNPHEQPGARGNPHGSQGGHGNPHDNH